MATKIDDLEGELKAALLEAKAISDSATDADRDFSDDERAQVTGAIEKAKEIAARLKKAKGDDATRRAIADLGDGIGLSEKSGPQERRADGLILPQGGKSIGQLYAESAEFAELLASAPGGQFSAKSRVQSRPTGFKSLIGGSKALVTGASDTSAGAFVQTDYRGLQVGLDIFQRPLTLRNLVTNGTTTSDTIEYTRLTSTTNNAAPVPEATSSAMPIAPGGGGALTLNAGGGYKPESGLALAKVNAVVKTIAHWIPVTKRALSDAAQIRTLIDNFLQYGLEEELEDQMVAGDNTGENFEGLATVSGTQDQAWTTDFFTTTRKALTKVRVVGRSRPNGFLLNPADVETMDLLQDNEGRFYSGGPFGQMGATQMLWGVPVVQSEAVPAGTGWVGDWRKAILWDREQAQISTTDSHADFFVRNLVAILAEMRAAFGVIQPSAFVEIDLTA